MSTTVETTVTRRATGQFIWVAIPSLVFLLHAALFATWIVDDAGISFAYARNLALGYGLVSQPGLPPVEGYSNPLWVFLLALLYRLHLFTVIATPKIVSCVLVIGAFLLLSRVMTRAAGASKAAGVVALTLLALNTSFVVWTTSGLENPLYVFLLSALTCGSLELVTHPRPPRSQAIAVGLLATAIALTRSEGVLYFAAFPMLLLVSRAYRAYRGAAPVAPALLSYTAAFALSLGAFLLFRWHYFGELLPNTYYAKGTAFSAAAQYGPMFALSFIWRLLELVAGIGGLIGVLAAAWLLFAAGYLMSARRFGMARAGLVTMTILTGTAYLLLPPDWMKEYRFATPFLVFFYLTIVLITADFLGDPGLTRRRGVTAAIAVATLALGGSVLVFAGRSLAFMREPEVDFAGVKGWISDRFDRYADELAVAQGSLLVPDLGATLWYSRLRVYDLGKLCDKTIARTMVKHPPAFYHYVFEVAKPTFIHTHGNWSYYAMLDEDPRFRRDYVPISEVREGEGKTHPVFSGDYVRKEIARGQEATLERLGREGYF